MAAQAIAPPKTVATQGSLLLGTSNIEEENEDEVQMRPQLIYTKFQRLKNTSTLACVKIIDEMPTRPIPSPNYHGKTTRDTDGLPRTDLLSADAMTVSETGLSSVGASLGGAGLIAKTQQTSVGKSQQPRTLLLYPEENHSVNQAECEQINSRVMKNLMKQKMGKNQTFYQSKMITPQMRTSSPIVNAVGQNTGRGRVSRDLGYSSNQMNISQQKAAAEARKSSQQV